MTQYRKSKGDSTKEKTRKPDPLEMEVVETPADEAVVPEETPAKAEEAVARWIKSPTGKECPQCHLVILGLEMRKVHDKCPRCGVALAE